MNIVRLMLLSRQMKNRRHEKDNMVTGIPPLTFTAKKTGTLKNYRIYGQTVDGESVGDRTGNLFDENGTKTPGFIDNNGHINTTTYIPGGVSTYDYIECNASTSYYLRAFSKIDPTSSSITQRVSYFNSDKEFISRVLGAGSFSFTTPDNCSYIRLSPDDNYHNVVLMQGSTEPSEFIPYGYKVPVTVSNGTDAQTIPIYLSEQIRKVGDEAEYIDFGEQKQYFADGTSIDITLPALPVLPGTNTLTVGTEVQPSRVELTGRIKEAQTNGSGNT